MDWALLPLSTWNPRFVRYPIKSGQRIIITRAGHENAWTFQVGCRCNSYLQHNLIIHPGSGGNWCIQHFAYAGHHPPSMYGPTHVPEGPQHPCWLPASPDASEVSYLVQRCLTNGGRSLTESMTAQTILRARRSIGCLAPPSSCLRDLLQHLISLLSAVASPGRWSHKEVVEIGVELP